MAVEIAARDFAEMLLRSPDSRETYLRKVKYRGNGFAPPYATARAVIPRYVSGATSRGDVLSRATDLRSEAQRKQQAPVRRPGQPKLDRGQRDLNNAEMIEAFVRHFDLDGITETTQPSLRVSWEDVRIRATPDFQVVRRGRVQLYKLLYAKRVTPREGRINEAIAGLIHFAAEAAQGDPVDVEAYLYGVRHGRQIPCIRPEPPFRRQCYALAAYIKDLWPHLERHRANDPEPPNAP
jgi:hypothetical protein